MTYGHLDSLVAYTRLVSASSVIVAVSSAWKSSSATSNAPFTNIIKGHDDGGFYFDSKQPDDTYMGPKAWELWNADDRDELIGAVDKCWKSLSDLATERSGRRKSFIYGPDSASTATERITVQHPYGESGADANPFQHGLIAAEVQRVTWRVSIMATQPESLVRFAARESTYRDWVLVLHKENSVNTGPADSQSMITNSHDDAGVDFAPDDIRRPSLATNTSTSSASSKMTQLSLKSSRSSGNRKIEIKGGIPMPIRAASETTKFTLPAEGSIASKTVLTPMPSSLTPHEYSGWEETLPNHGQFPISDHTNTAPILHDEEISDEPTVWDDTSVAPVNPEDLVNLAVNSPIGMVLATPELRLYWVNERWYDITRVEHGQDLNTWIEGIHPDSMPTLMEVLQGLMQDKVKRTGDIRWKHDTWSTFTAQVLLNAEGTVTAVAATIDDCTQRKTLELAQMEALKEKEATARRIAEQASLRAKELAEWQQQSRILEQRTKEFAQMAEISSIALTCAKPDGELIWGKLGDNKRRSSITLTSHCLTDMTANQAFVRLTEASIQLSG